MARRTCPVIFFAAAGPRRGFGHVVRCASLARALGVPLRGLLRGSSRTARAAARLGWTVPALPRAAWPALRPGLVVVDDPSRPVTQRIVRRAREAGARVVVISDLGGNRGTGADLTVDGSLRPGRPARRTDLNGPRFAVLNPDLAQAGECPVSRREPRVVIALGGGSHVRSLGTQLARRLAGRAPGVRVALASGFSGRGLRPTLPASCEWLEPGGLFTALRTAAVAVVAGGLTLYEACALGTPVVALAVTPAQRVATRAFARAGAAIDVSATVRAPALALAAEATLALLSDRDRAAALGHRGGRLVDGDGAARVARRIRKLLVQGPDARRPHAA